jgi:hypothetical protein
VKALIPLREPELRNQTATELTPGTTIHVDQVKQPIKVPLRSSNTKPTLNKSRISRWFWLLAIGLVLLGFLGWVVFSQFLNHPGSLIQLTLFPTIEPSPAITTTPNQNPTPTPKTTSEPGVLYSDDFSNEQSGWRQEAAGGGVVKYSSGQYVVSLEKGIGMGWSCAHHYFTDAVLTVDTILVSGDPNLTGPTVIWRFVDYQDFYALRLFGNGNWYIEKLLNGEWKSISDLGLVSPLTGASKL